MRPEVWAPRAERVDVVRGDGSKVPLERTAGGWFRGAQELAHGDRYGFALDGDAPLPDPRSTWQPDGVHGLSAVDDPSRHRWSDGEWPGLALFDGVIYELHVGTFTRAGTLDAAIERLDHLVDLGVTAVELLPLAEAMGERGWGYDGVDLWAVHHVYGGPAALRRFVDAAHQVGIGVLLDVVYNHLGPEGAYLDRFGPYFTDRRHTPWGASVNLDGPGSEEIRRFIVDNAVHWCAEHHIDGLRIDATHQLIDDSPRHIVTEIGDALAALGKADGRRRWTIVEREQSEALPLLPPERGGWGIDARWGDDLHHAIHAALTGERDGYYEPFGRLADIATVLRRGHLPPGDEIGPDIGRHRLVVCAQNHDQVGNRPAGERLHHLTDDRAAMAAAAIVLLAPGTPMLFQGEEWGASSPFPFFCDTEDAVLAEQIRTGRHNELEPLGWSADEIQDPLAPATFASARLDWDEIGLERHRTLLDWHRSLIGLRRSLPDLRHRELRATADDARRTLVVHHGGLVLVVNLGDEPVAVPPFGDVALANAEVRVDGAEAVVPPRSVAIFRSTDGPGPDDG